LQLDTLKIDIDEALTSITFSVTTQLLNVLRHVNGVTAKSVEATLSTGFERVAYSIKMSEESTSKTEIIITKADVMPTTSKFAKKLYEAIETGAAAAELAEKKVPDGVELIERAAEETRIQEVAKLVDENEAKKDAEFVKAVADAKSAATLPKKEKNTKKTSSFRKQLSSKSHILQPVQKKSGQTKIAEVSMDVEEGDESIKQPPLWSDDDEDNVKVAAGEE
jgi:hypothetical protein